MLDDSASEESEEAVETKRSPCVILPDSGFRIVWDMTMFLFIIYQAITLPTRIAFEFEQNAFMFNFEFTIDVCFMVDVLLNLNTGIVKKGIVLLGR